MTVDSHSEDKTNPGRLAFGLHVLDAHLGGGLRPGTLTVIAGATGVGKTQLGLRWAAIGETADRAPGAIIDLTSRGDTQNHEAYSESHFGHGLTEYPIDHAIEPSAFWDSSRRPNRVLRPFAQVGRRVTRPDLDADAWHAWKSDLGRVLRVSAAFAYHHMVRGCRRFLIDGLEPTDIAADSVQFDYVEYLQHRILKQDDSWAAREVLREMYRANEPEVLNHAYNSQAVASVVLYTTPQVLLDDMIAQPIGSGGLLATANTVILMGRTSHNGRLGRALCIIKHRGSACRDDVLPYRIGDMGLEFDKA